MLRILGHSTCFHKARSKATELSIWRPELTSHTEFDAWIRGFRFSAVLGFLSFRPEDMIFEGWKVHSFEAHQHGIQS